MSVAQVTAQVTSGSAGLAGIINQRRPEAPAEKPADLVQPPDEHYADLPTGWTLHIAPVRGSLHNTYYEEAVLIDGIASLRRALEKDHISGLMRDRRRTKLVSRPKKAPWGTSKPSNWDELAKDFYPKHNGEVNLIECDVLKLDIDNADTENPGEWVQIKAVLDLMQSYGFPVIVVPSKSHMKDKTEIRKRKSGDVEVFLRARPRFHLYVPMGKKMTDPEELQLAHDQLAALLGHKSDPLSYIQLFYGRFVPWSVWTEEHIQFRAGDGDVLAVLNEKFPAETVDVPNTSVSARKSGNTRKYRRIKDPKHRPEGAASAPGAVGKYMDHTDLYQGLADGYVWLTYQLAYPLEVWAEGITGHVHNTFKVMVASLWNRCSEEAIREYCKDVYEILPYHGDWDNISSVIDWTKREHNER